MATPSMDGLAANEAQPSAGELPRARGPRGNYATSAVCHRIPFLVAGLLIALLFSDPGSAQTEDHHKTSPTQQAAPDTKQPLSITVTGPVRVEREKEIEPDWNRMKCSEAKSHDEADLCEQRRMAKAAEDTRDLGLYQLTASVFGIVFVVWNLFYIRKATGATVAAAEAAATQAKIAAETMERQERPFLSISATGGMIFDGEEAAHRIEMGEPGYLSLRATLTITNVGFARGYLRRAQLSVAFASKAKPPLPIGEGELLTKINAPVAHQIPHTLTQGEWTIGPIPLEKAYLFRTGGDPLIFLGRILYLDLFERPRERGFAFQAPFSALDGSNAFARWGGQEYNYDRAVAYEPVDED